MEESLRQAGFAMIPSALKGSQCLELIETLGPVSRAARRGLLGVPIVADLASSSQLLNLVRAHLSSEARPVRVLYFDKTPEKNWLVSWHQDLTLALFRRVDVPGFGPWSTKDGVPHVQPPIELLEQMLTIRLHLDDCDETNGALRVIPGSHNLGRLSAERIRELTEHSSAIVCPASVGDALLMSPLLLHASSRSQNPTHRRILHIEYAAFALPPELQWKETV